MAEGEKSMERGQLMIGSDWIIAHRINLGMYIHYSPPCFVELEMAERPLDSAKLIARGNIEVTAC